MKAYDVIMLGPSCIDEYYDLKSPLVMGDKSVCDFMGYKLGGMISNAAAISASYGLTVALIDQMNRSASSNRIVEGLEEHRVDSSLVGYDDNLDDAKCIIMLYEGERFILVVNNNKHHMQFTEEQKTALLHTKFLYTTVVDLQRYEHSLELLSEMKRNGVKVFYDVEGSTVRHPEIDMNYLDMADVISANEGGIGALQKFFGPDCLEHMVERGTIVVETLGTKGCRVLAKGRDSISSPAFPVEPVDTTGAGDTFNTTFVYGLLQGWNLEECALL